VMAHFDVSLPRGRRLVLRQRYVRTVYGFLDHHLGEEDRSGRRRLQISASAPDVAEPYADLAEQARGSVGLDCSSSASALVTAASPLTRIDITRVSAAQAVSRRNWQAVAVIAGLPRCTSCRRCETRRVSCLRVYARDSEANHEQRSDSDAARTWARPSSRSARRWISRRR